MTYSNVRVETHAVREHIVLTLWQNPQVARIWEDGTDLVVVSFKNGVRVMFQLVDSLMEVHEIQKVLTHNAEKGFYTLFMFWSEMLLPANGERYTPDDWMQAMLALYGDKIYGYEASSTEVFIFPVHFQPQTGYNERFIRWGKSLSLNRLQWEVRHLESVHLRGQFRVANFERLPDATKTQEQAPPSSFTAVSHSLHAYYVLFNLPLNASAEDIRQAYRTLARQYHPDLNPAPEATEKMQALNQAYTQLMAQFE